MFYAWVLIYGIKVLFKDYKSFLHCFTHWKDISPRNGLTLTWIPCPSILNALGNIVHPLSNFSRLFFFFNNFFFLLLNPMRDALYFPLFGFLRDFCSLSESISWVDYMRIALVVFQNIECHLCT